MFGTCDNLERVEEWPDNSWLPKFFLVIVLFKGGSGVGLKFLN